MTVTVDCNKLQTKMQFLGEMQKIFEDIYALNYDAFIDGARGTESPITVNVCNIDNYEDKPNLEEVFTIIEQENPLIRFNII